jgi:hypothetical protein
LPREKDGAFWHQLFPGKPIKGSLAITGDCYGRRIHQEQFLFSKRHPEDAYPKLFMNNKFYKIYNYEA